jgi:hypothetical protein
MWSDEFVPFFQMTTNSNPQCSHEEDVVGSFGSQGAGYTTDDLPTHSSVDVNNCFIAATVFTKYTDGSSGGAFDTNYITDIAFTDASYEEHRLTGLGGEESEEISFGNYG